MNKIPRVADYMARKLVTLSPGEEINHAMNTLLNNGISGAPVVDEEGWLVGVLSKKDCLRAAIEASYYRSWSGTVADYMARDPQTVEADASVLDLAKKFTDSNYRRYPVLRAGQLVGQISRADALRAMRDLW
ncbi:MAG: CBS domain-containing protein [Pseudomonadota bacterium]